jgi:hypothetical protein
MDSLLLQASLHLLASLMRGPVVGFIPTVDCDPDFVAIMLSSLLLLVAGVTAYTCLTDVACILAAAGVPLVLNVLTVSCLPAVAGVPGVVDVPAIAFVLAVAGVAALA